MNDNGNPTKSRRLFFLSIYFIMFITGLVVLSTGAILPEIVKEFGINYEMAGFLLSLQAIGNISAVIVSGILSDFIGKKAVLIGGSLMVAIGFLGLIFVSSATVLFVLIFIAGCGWGTNNVINSAMNDVTGGSAKHLNRAHMFFAVGAFTAPFFVILADTFSKGWRIIGGITGILAVCSVIFLTVIKFPTVQKVKQKQENSKIRTSFEAFKHGRYYVFLAISFTYVAVETVMNGWITTYFQGTGILMAVQAKIALSLIWVSIMIGRFTVSIVGDKIKKEHIIVTCASIILVFSVVLIQLHSFISVAVCVFALGIGLSALFPTNVANSAYLVQSSGMATGILLGSGGVGAAVGPVITGVVTERLNLSASMWVSVGFAFILLLTASINLILGKHTKK